MIVISQLDLDKNCAVKNKCGLRLVPPNYQHLCEHYGTAIVPARAMSPKDKAKVENAVGIVERQLMAPLRHRTFTSLAEINVALKEGLKKLALEQNLWVNL